LEAKDKSPPIEESNAPRTKAAILPLSFDQNAPAGIERILTTRFDTPSFVDSMIESFHLPGKALKGELGVPSINNPNFVKGAQKFAFDFVGLPNLASAITAKPSSNMLRTGFTGKDKDKNFHDDLSTEELITGYILAPTVKQKRNSNVSIDELAIRLKKDPEVKKQNEKLNIKLDEEGYGETVSVFRMIKNPTKENIKKEEIVSASLSSEGLGFNLNFFTTGKIGMDDKVTILKYDVPREDIIGYFPLMKDKIKQNIVNKKIKEKNMVPDISGYEKITNPSKAAKELIEKQDEIIVDVSKLEPTVLKRPFSNEDFNYVTMEGRMAEGFANKFIKNEKDLGLQMGPNYSVLNPMTLPKKYKEKYGEDLTKETFDELEKQAKQKVVEHFSDFFTPKKEIKKAKGGQVSIRDGIGDVFRLYM
tara:strand:+ start:206 stop:1462 length:1257 start_codon:yes stop_codon:yes gene_type:complete